MCPLVIGNTWESTSVWMLILLQIVGLSGAYFVAETTSSWSADKNCSIAKPPLQFDNGRITTDISNLQLDDNAHIWVGYYTSLAQFQYVGCVRSDASGINSQPGVTTGDPGQCFSACPKPMPYIGVCKNKCYCLANIPYASINTTEHGCQAKCTNQPGVACGGEDRGVQYVSLYSFIKGIQDFEEALKYVNGVNCLAFDTRIGLGWNQCNSDFLGMCYAGNAVWQSYTQSGSNYNNWTVSADRCFMNNSRPTTVNYSHSASNVSGSALWTGIMRSWVVFKSTEKATNRNIRYGYLTKVNNTSNTYVLNFTSEDSTMAVLCETGSEQTDNAEGQSDPNIIVPVVLSVFVFIIAVSIVVAFFVLKKRGTIPYLFQKWKDSNKSQQPEPDYNYPDFDLPDDTGNIHKYLKSSANSHGMHVNESAEQEETNHDYLVLEEHEKELDSLETDYDKIESGKTRHNRGTNNVYNTLQSDTHATYDRAFINEHISISANDNTYDTSETSAIKPNGIGEKTGNIYNKTDEADNDTYNHINMKAPTNDKQDNAYGVPKGQTEGDYDGIDDRTLDNCSTGTPITDNTYTKIKAVT